MSAKRTTKQGSRSRRKRSREPRGQVVSVDRRGPAASIQLILPLRGIRPPDPILLDDFGSRMISVSFTRRRSSTWAVPTSRRRFAGSTGRG